MRKTILLITIFFATKELNSENYSSILRPRNTIHLARLICAGKIALVTVTASALILYHKKTILYHTAKYPITSLAGACLICNFFCDSILKYQQIQRTLFLLEASQKINRYIMYAISIKNTMLQLCKKNTEYSFYEADFFQELTSQIPLSFQELEEFTIDILHNCIKEIQNLHIELQTDIDSKIYFLSKSHLTVEEALFISTQDQEIHDQLKHFYESPSHHYQATLLRLNSLIKKHLHDIIEH